VAVVTLAEGVPEEDVVGKQDGECCKREVRVPEQKVFGKMARVISEHTDGLRKTSLANKLPRCDK